MPEDVETQLVLPAQRASSRPRAASGPAAGGPSRAPAALRALRPRQWSKNLLVLGAPLAAGRVGDPEVLLGCAVAVVLFCAAASSVYLVNDVADADRDRLHPTKRYRPIAAREIPPAVALAMAVVLGVGSVALGLWWSVPLGGTLLVYLAVQAAYSGGLKHQPGLDLAVVSSGFLLRAVAGGTATDIVLSPWFLLVASFGSLFMVAGKRYSEIRRLGSGSETRRSLQMYSESYLRFIWTMAAGVTVVVYILWALNGVQASDPLSWQLVSVAPFVLALLRYTADVDRGTAESPEEIVLSDRHLQVVGAAWLVMLLLHAVLG